MVAAPNESLVLSFEDARRAVENHASAVTAHEIETVGLGQSAGRVLAEPLTADRDIPPFPRSTRDGYAVRSADIASLPAKLKVIGEIKAGPRNSPRSLNPGESYSIMTGAPVPGGADAVLMVEYSSQRGEEVQVGKHVTPGENIVPRGAEAAKGSMLLDRGTRLNESGIAVAASVGKAQLRVFRRPHVAILATGDEVVDVHQTPGPGQIRNSNSYSLAAQVQQAGGDPVILPVAPDESASLRGLIEQGLQSDLLIMAGGVSMGRYDLVEQVLAELEAQFVFTGAKIQPGRPVVFGRMPYSSGGPTRQKGGHKYFFGLPGNPVSSMVTFELFARPMLEALAGMKARSLAFLHARLESEIRVKPGLTRFLPAIFSGKFGDSHVELVPWQGSGDIAAQARANCYIVVPANRESISPGEWVAIMSH